MSDPRMLGGAGLFPRRDRKKDRHAPLHNADGFEIGGLHALKQYQVSTQSRANELLRPVAKLPAHDGLLIAEQRVTVLAVGKDGSTFDLTDVRMHVPGGPLIRHSPMLQLVSSNDKAEEDETRR